MHRYFIKTPAFVRWWFSSYVWKMEGPAVYLTFDDGPHPQVTPWVLEQLRGANAKATFFCIGENVERYPEIYQSIIDEGHSVGNHSYTHPNGWHTATEIYLDDVRKATGLISSSLFRPPYGRIKAAQAAGIPDALSRKDASIIMWDVLSADFDPSFTPEQCLHNVLHNVSEGSIVVFHDSERAERNLRYSLPATLDFLQQRRFEMKKL